MSSIFIISHYEIGYNLRNEESVLIKDVKRVDDINFKNILTFLSMHINNDAEKMYHVFNNLETSAQMRTRFLPNEYNTRTKFWGSSASVLASFPWLDFVSVNINGEVGSYMHQTAPYLRKYIKVPIDENLTLFTTETENGKLVTTIGVPFWSNDTIEKYVNDPRFEAFFLSKEPDQWLLYSVEKLLNIDTNTLVQNKNILYPTSSSEAITLHSQKSFDFLNKSLKKMLNVTKKGLRRHPDLINILKNPKKSNTFIKDQIKDIHPHLRLERNYCIGPFCDFSNEGPVTKWSTRRDFQHRVVQKTLIWELGMSTLLGLWDYSPFSDNAPDGVVTAVDPTLSADSNFFKHVTEGFFITDVFRDTPLNIPRTCTLKTENPEYDKRILVHNSKNGSAKSCRNERLNILYRPGVDEPFLTTTNFITYINPPMKTPNELSLTIGIALDPFLLGLALVYPDDVALITGEGNIRLYTTVGDIVNLTLDNNWRENLINNDEGILIDSMGKKLYFKYIAKITANDGYIVIIEKQESRITIIDGINKNVQDLYKKVTLHSALLILVTLIIISIILNAVINSITNPIKELVEITKHIQGRSLDKIKISKKLINKQDEIGTLFTAFSTMLTSMKEGIKVRGLLDKVVSKQVAEKIVREGIKLGGEKRHLTVVFCDIRNFTTITEKMDPEDVLIMLNECLSLLSGIIDDFEGVIDKYEGDKIMTLFGAPLETKNHELQACLCAIEMQKALLVWNTLREEQGLCKLEVGIGIHSGEAVAGNVGAENHLSYTVLGHIVNLSARICDYAEGREILITKETLDVAKAHITYREKPPKKFKGISEPVITFSVLKKI